jgi:methyltransferase-like protein/2-polyprenyl-3-methyl-5-hydroxy-6-metoxy-1,4-benzoquinol methylase
MNLDTHRDYDTTPYDSLPYPQSHPACLATLATIFGMTPGPIDACRVLELGCASGGNLVPMACGLPESRFVGIELSSLQASNAQAFVKALGLRNIEIRQCSIMDVDAEIGRFDFIIAHGVYSWVPDSVQDKILAICQEHLTEHGVAYISYNTYPGWHYRGMIRDMMLYHTKQFSDPSIRVVQARALLDFLAQSVAGDNAYGIMLKTEVDQLRRVSDSYLLHDHLEKANHPLYFVEFIDRAARYGLQYLAEAEFHMMLTSNFPKEVRETLARVSNEIVRTEQYMDFLRNRMFRQTLLCRKERSLQRNLNPSCVTSLYVASGATPETEPLDIHVQAAVTFRMPNGRTFTTANPLVKAAFQCLSERWPQSVPFEWLLDEVRRRLDPGLRDEKSATEQAQLLGGELLFCYSTSLVELRMQPADFVTSVSEYPRTTALAREQAKLGRRITNQRHEPTLVNEFSRQIILLLDGTRSRPELLGRLLSLVADGTLVVTQENKTGPQAQNVEAPLAREFEISLADLARAALLVA